MGKANSKEEIIINQASNGDARGQISTKNGLTLSEILLIGLVVTVIAGATYLVAKRCQKGLRKNIRREVNREMLRRSTDALNQNQNEEV